MNLNNRKILIPTDKDSKIIARQKLQQNESLGYFMNSLVERYESAIDQDWMVVDSQPAVLNKKG